MKVSLLFAEVSFSQEEKRVYKLHESVVQEIRADIQELLSHCIFGSLQILLIDAMELRNKIKYCVGGRDGGHQKTFRRNGMGICGIWNLNIGTYY